MKKIKNVITRDFKKNLSSINNMYEITMIIAIRSKQFLIKIKKEISSKINEFINNDNNEEIYENKEQIEISKCYEKMQKPTIKAIEEFLNNNIIYKYSSLKENNK